MNAARPVSGCQEHSCWRTAPGGYCLPLRCYCGGCPWYQPIEQLPTYTPDTYTAFDRAAQAKGQQVPNRRTRLAAS